ncbi:hypothetical protein [Sphingobacterium sp. MYb388]|uniref:hypothetical protein n=1 Tax=Sphingobacterium sp. MYb388 TaxID=2745437 RepID=UPI0030D77C34
MKREIELIIVIACFSIVAFSCKGKQGKIESYVQALEQSEGLQKTVRAGQVVYKFSLQTAESMALRDSYDQDKKYLDDRGYKKRLVELDGYMFIRIDHRVEGKDIPILQYNCNGNKEYEKRLMYYEFSAANDIRLVCNGSEYPPSSYHYENRLGLSAINTIIVAFPKCQNAESWQVTFNDQGLNNLLLKANFYNKDIEELPSLVIK